MLDFSVLGGLEADPSKMETLLGEGTLKHDGNTEQVEIDCEIEDEGRESTVSSWFFPFLLFRLAVSLSLRLRFSLLTSLLTDSL